MATHSRNLRQGLPRFSGGEPWPPPGGLPVKQTQNLSDASATLVTSFLDSREAGPASLESDVLTLSALHTGDQKWLRRGLPRTPNGSSWPPPTPLNPESENGSIKLLNLAASTPCRAAQLRLNSETGDAGAGNRTNVFGVTNTGIAPCSVAGYPSVSLLDAQGSALTAVRSDQNPQTATPVNIPVGGKVFFDIAWNVVPNEGAVERVCPSAARVRVLIPGDPAALAIPLAFTPCGGRIRVNPFRAGVEPGQAPEPVRAASAA